ncbi:MAG: serine/threonine-protein kinase, partial [Myxococcota bacterium]|nr:serine/threonine-protein kinase [Myxococcota bacterium]
TDFLDEARVLSSLNHPNIVSILEVAEWNGRPLIVMEYINGMNLGELVRLSLRHGTKIPFNVVARIICDCAMGLGFAHNAKNADDELLHLVHRDISPGNLMLRPDGVTKVLDFGIAKAADSDHRTETGVVKGKLSYMSPEQLGGDNLDGRSDQFSLGIVFWELCTRSRIFKDAQNPQIIQRILHGIMDAPSTVEEEIPNELENMIMRMLSANKEKRFATLEELAQALEAYLAGSNQPTTSVDVAQYIKPLFALREKDVAEQKEQVTQELKNLFGAPTRISKKKSRLPWRLTLSAAILLVAGVFAVYGLNQAQTTTPSESSSNTEAKKVLPIAPLVPPQEVAKTAQTKPLTKPNPKKRKLKKRPKKPKAKVQKTEPDKKVEPQENKDVAQTVHISIRTDPWAQLFLDGKPVGITPFFKLSVDTGKHELRFINEDEGITRTYTVNLKGDKQERLYFDLRK